MKEIMGRKVGMTQVFDTDSGRAIPVTVIKAGPCWVTAIRTQQADGYDAVQLGFEEVPDSKLTRGELGHLKKHGGKSLRHLHEVRLHEPSSISAGVKVTVDMFAEGEYVDVTGISKGKGFTGAVKRYGFAGGPKTHGQSDRHRAPGSRGAGTTPGRTFKGSRGPGHMGHAKVTILSQRVTLVDPERDLLAIRGAVPGPRDGLVVIRAAVKKNTLA